MSTTILNNVLETNPNTSTVGRILKNGVNFLKSMNLSISDIKYNEVFKNDKKTVMAFFKVYLRTKLINALFFCLFLFFASAAFVYSLFHIRYDKQNVSNRIGHIIAQFSFTISLLLLIILMVINLHRFGFFYLSYYKSFLISFFMYTLSILLFRQYNKTVQDEENPVFQLMFFYSFVTLFVLSLLGMFVLFSIYFRSFSDVQLCKFNDNSKLSIYYFIGFLTCQFVVFKMLL